MEMLSNFVDKEGRDIIITLDDSGIICAKYKQNEVGKFIYQRQEYPINPYGDPIVIYTLYNANIQKDYQLSGIGTEMIKSAHKHFKNVQYPSDQLYSLEGASFLDNCVEKGIILRTQTDFDNE